MITEALVKKSFVGKILPVETNIIIFEVFKSYTPKQFAEELAKFSIFVMPISTSQVRIVTHLDITPPMINHLITIIDSL